MKYEMINNIITNYDQQYLHVIIVNKIHKFFYNFNFILKYPSIIFINIIQSNNRKLNSKFFEIYFNFDFFYFKEQGEYLK